MHELSVCQSLLSQLEKLTHQHQALRVASLKVQLGPLAGVVPELLEHAFQIARADTIAANAELLLDISPIRVHCLTCSADSEATPNKLICGICGDWHTQLLSGDEMLLVSVELVTE